MEIRDGVLVLSAAEINQGCPRNEVWAVSQLRSYPLDVVLGSEKLSPLLRCTEMLERAGIFRAVEGEPAAEAEDSSATVDEPAGETE